MSKPVACNTPNVNPKGNNGFWVVPMCQCRFISCKQCIMVGLDVDSGGNCAYVGLRAHKKYLYLPFIFALNLNL